jgi:hypothetical protein
MKIDEENGRFIILYKDRPTQEWQIQGLTTNLRVATKSCRGTIDEESSRGHKTFRAVVITENDYDNGNFRRTYKLPPSEIFTPLSKEERSKLMREFKVSMPVPTIVRPHLFGESAVGSLKGAYYSGCNSLPKHNLKNQERNLLTFAKKELS